LCCIRGSVTDQHKHSTLPFMVIRGLQQATPALRQLIQAALVQTGLKQTKIVKQPIANTVIEQICTQTDALAYTRKRIEIEIKKARQAVEAFPESVYRQALVDLAIQMLVAFDADLVDLSC
jgi:geranylgeranyl pyrophosphate synthase